MIQLNRNPKSLLWVGLESTMLSTLDRDLGGEYEA